MYLFGLEVYTCLFIAMTTKLAMTTLTWTLGNVLCITLLSIVFYVAFLFIYGDWLYWGPVFYGLPSNMSQSPSFFMLALLIPLLIYILDVSLEHVHLQLFPE